VTETVAQCLQTAAVVQSTLARSDEALLSKSATKGPDLGCTWST